MTGAHAAHPLVLERSVWTAPCDRWPALRSTTVTAVLHLELRRSARPGTYGERVISAVTAVAAGRVIGLAANRASRANVRPPIHQTVLMERGRAKDRLIGATGMLLVLVVGIMVLWWVASDPAGGGEPGSGSSQPAGAERPPAGEPPADLGEDEVWFAELTLDAGTVVTAGSTLHDVRAVGQDVVTSSDGVVAGRATVDATVPFEVVADALGEGTAVRAADGGQAMVVRTVQALGRELRVASTGTVEVEAGRLVVEPRSIDIGGPDLLSDAFSAVVRGLVTIEHDIEGLPEGLVLQDVAVQEDGFRARLRGEGVELLP